MRKMVVVLSLMLAGCSSAQREESHPQYAQNAKLDTARALTMEQLCRANAAHQYNTRADRVALEGMEAFQGSYEVRGETSREERFTCTFEPNGQFLHLSMR